MRYRNRVSAVLFVSVLLLGAIAASFVNAGAIAGGGYTNKNTIYASGIDLSYWNFASSDDDIDYSRVDFAGLPAEGCTYVILRIGYGGASSGYTLDETFVTAYQRARASGINIGLYFYTYSTTYSEAASDAYWVMSIIEQYGMYFEYPIYYDVEEDTHKAMSASNLVSFCSGWCDTLASYNYFPGIYTSYYPTESLNSDSTFNSNYDIWLAYYSSSGTFDPYTDDCELECGMWQYAEYGFAYDSINPPSGMESRLDVNVAYKDYPTIMAENGYNNVPTPALDAAIKSAESAAYYSYTADGIESLRSVYDEAVALRNNSDATNDEKNAMADRLNAAVANYAVTDETLLSSGKSYTTTVPNRDEGDSIDWDDDQIRLTDGVKGNSDVLNNGYSAWAYSATVDVTVDLGSVMASNVYRVYSAGGEWGVSLPSDFSVSYSSDGSSFITADIDISSSRVGTNSPWTFNCYTLTSDVIINARYIRISITPDGEHTWLDEVEVYYDTTPALSGCIYVDGFNSRITGGETYLYTSAFGTVTVDNANHAYAQNVVAKWSDADKAYVVTSTFEGSGVSTTPSVTLASDEIMISAHNHETGVTDGSEVLGSERNFKNLALLQVGDLIELNGIDPTNRTLDVASYITTAVESVRGDLNSDDSVSSLDYVLLKRYVMNTYSLSVTQLRSADINRDGMVNFIDYVLLKRAVVGTYVI